MTIAATQTQQRYVANGSSTQFSFPNKIFSATDLVVTLFDTTGLPYSFTNFLNTATGLSYTVQNVDVDTGCTVVFSSAPQNLWIVDIRSVIPDTQSTSIKNQGAFLPELHEEAFDRATRLIQDLLRLSYTFGIHGPDLESTPWPSLPIAASRKGMGLIFDSNGLPTLGAPAAQTIAANQLAYNGTDSGGANTCIVSVTSPGITFGLNIGTLLGFFPHTLNNGPATLNANASGAQPIVWSDSTALSGGELQPSYFSIFEWTGSAWQFVNPPNIVRKTAAESAASATIVQYSYPESHAFRYLDVTNSGYITANNLGSQNATTVTAACQTALTVNGNGGRRAEFPPGSYAINGTGLLVTKYPTSAFSHLGAEFFFTDSGGAGGYGLTVGQSGATLTNLVWENLMIQAQTQTACCLHIVNAVFTHFTGNTWLFGFQGSYGTRSNIGLRIESTGNGCWFNKFDHLYLDHLQYGLQLAAGGGSIATQQLFGTLQYYGDALSGANNQLAIDIAGCPYTTIGSCWIEQCGAAGIGIRSIGGTNLRIGRLVFDVVGVPYYFDNTTANVKFYGVEYSGSGTPVDASTSNSGNYIECVNIYDKVTEAVATTNNRSRAWGIQSYDLTQKPFLAIEAAVSSVTNQVIYGGGDSSGVAATVHSIYTAANNTTATGTEVVRVDFSTTAGDTRMMLWDVNKGTLSRVTVGANDSGGTGFKLLRVPN